MYDVVSNPIPCSGFFATPDSVEDLIKYTENFTGQERVVATTVLMMALNLANKLVEDKILSKEIFCS
jgi:hypothetical protein